MAVSLHLNADPTEVGNLLVGLLLPETSAVLADHDHGLAIYAEQMTSDISDIEEFAVPLSELALVYAVIFERQTEVYTFSKGALQSITHTLPEHILPEHLLEFETALSLCKASILSGKVLEAANPKPGLGEFFGRSADE